MVLTVSRKFFGKGIPDKNIKCLSESKRFVTHQSCLETYSHHREGFVTTSSMHQHILVRGVSLAVCISRRPPKDIRNWNSG